MFFSFLRSELCKDVTESVNLALAFLVDRVMKTRATRDSMMAKRGLETRASPLAWALGAASKTGLQAPRFLLKLSSLPKHLTGTSNGMFLNSRGCFFLFSPCWKFQKDSDFLVTTLHSVEVNFTQAALDMGQGWSVQEALGEG